MKKRRNAVLWLAGAVAVIACLVWRPWPAPRVDHNRVYRMGYGRDVPFHYQGPDGKPTGLAVEMVKAAAARRQIKLEWFEGKGMNDTGTDLWVLMTIRTERLEDLHITDPYLQTHTCFVVPDKSPAHEVTDLEGGRISFLDFSIHRHNLNNSVPRMRPVPVQSSYEALREVVAGRADAAYLDEYAALPALLTGCFSTPLRVIPTHLPPAHMGIASSFAMAAVADELRDEMQRMAEDGSLQPIAEHWGFFPNLTTDMIKGAASAQRWARRLAVGVALLSLLLALTVSLALRARQQTRRLEDAQAKLKASEERWRAVVEAEPECVKLLDREGKIVEMNPAGLAMIQATLDDVRGKPACGVVAEADQAGFLEMVAAVFRGENRHLIFDIIGLKGRRLTLETTGVPLWEPTAPPRVRLLVGVTRDITERKRAEAALQESEAKFAKAFQSAPVLIAITDLADGTYLDVNEEALRISGFPRSKVIGHTPIELGWITSEQRARLLAELKAHGRINGLELEFRPRDGRSMIGLVGGERLSLSGHDCLLTVTVDITQRKQLEAQLRQSQKLEAVGQLAGGVAHDLNNVLAAMMLHLDFIRQTAALDDQTQESLKEVVHESQRAANLIRQLLMFSRRSVLEVKALDLSEVVGNLLKMLGRLLGEHISVRFERKVGLPMVEADPGMLEQVLMNLCVNARDAMPNGGRLAIDLGAVQVDEAGARTQSGARPGPFVCMSVSDTGCGMDEATLQRVFEPFFTTKEPGKGTGLGLATVHGIVGQHKGWVEVESKVGRGTTFRVFIPAASCQAVASAPPEQLQTVGGHEGILLVEDEAGVRRISAKTLRRLGYRVFEAANGPEALRVWHDHHGEIDLLLSDMVMPEGMSGLDLVEQLHTAKPGLKVIICSGYSMEMVGRALPSGKRILRLQKPYQIETLSQLVRQTLDQA